MIEKQSCHNANQGSKDLTADRVKRNGKDGIPKFEPERVVAVWGIWGAIGLLICWGLIEGFMLILHHII